jgi:hypothetical protein
MEPARSRDNTELIVPLAKEIEGMPFGDPDWAGDGQRSRPLCAPIPKLAILGNQLPPEPHELD